MRHTHLLLSLTALPALAVSLAGQSATPCDLAPLVELPSPSGAAEDGYGGRLTAEGDMLVVNALNQGLLHVFHDDGAAWQHVQTLTSPQPAGEIFWDLDLDGDTLVAAELVTSAPNRLHVWQRVGDLFQLAQTLEAPLVDGGFGYSLDLDDDLIAVSAAVGGEAWLYRRDGGTWGLETTLGGGGLEPYLESAAVHAGSVACGGLGELYVYDKVAGSWQYETLVIDTGAVFDLPVVGATIALSDDWLAYSVAGFGSSDHQYGFLQRTPAGFTNYQSIDVGSGSTTGLGNSATLDGGTALLGRYLFQLSGDTWVLMRQTTPGPGQPGTVRASDLAGGVAVVAFSPGVNDPGRVFGLNAGATAPDCLLKDQLSDACAIALGVGGDDDADGKLDACTDPWSLVEPGLAGTTGVPGLSGFGPLSPGSPVVLRLSGAAPDAPAWLVLSMSQLGAPFKGGVLHPSPDVILAGITTDSEGDLLVQAVWPPIFGVGLSVVAQWWVADAGGPAGFAASKGLLGALP